MADTPYSSLTAGTPQANDWLAVDRGLAGVGVRLNVADFLTRRADGQIYIPKPGAGPQELIFSLDPGSIGYGSRDVQIRAGNNGSNQTYLDIYTANAAAPVRAMRIDQGQNVTITGTLLVGRDLNVYGRVSSIASAGPPLFETYNPNAASGFRYIRWVAYNDGNYALERVNDAYNSAGRLLTLQTDNVLAPGADGSQDIGSAALRWRNIRATNGTIVTSDRNAKTQIGEVPDAWLDAWGDVQWRRFKLKDAVEEKGATARWHVGLIAQAVRDVFAARGLDATQIGLLCFDEWEDHTEPVTEERQVGTERVVVDMIPTGVMRPDGSEIMREVTEERPVKGQVDTGVRRVTIAAGSRWGLRYDECQAMEAAWQRRETARLRDANAALLDRIEALEAAA